MKFYRDLNYEQLVDLWRKEELKRKASRPTVLFHNAFTPAITSFGWAVDAGSAPSATSLAASGEDGTYNVDVSSGDVQLYLFVQVEEQGDDSSNNNVTVRLRYDPAGGTSFQNVTASSSDIFGTADGNTAATDEAAWTTGNFKLTGEEGTAFDGLELTDDTASAPTFDFQAANYTEFVWALTADQSTLSDNQSITFNVALGGLDVTLDVTPTLTVTKGAGTQNIEGSFLTNDSELYHGLVSPQNLFGSFHENTNNLFHGLITENIEGSLLTDTDELFHGEIATFYDIEGNLFEDTDDLFHGLVEPIALSGSLFIDDDNIYHGLLTLNVEGSLLIDSDNLYHGKIDLNLNGTLFSDSDELYHGQLNLNLNGSLISDEDNLFHGLISPANLFGSLLTDTDVFYHGEITTEGAAAQDIEGHLLEDADLLYHGEIIPGTFDIQNSLFIDVDNLYHGQIIRILQQIFNNSLEDDDTLNHGIISHSLTNSLLSDVDILHHGAISYNINNSLFQDEDLLYHGEFNVSIGSSLFEDGDIFYNSVAIGNNSIEGTFLENTDNLYHGKVTHSIEGQILQDVDVISHGFISADLMSSIFEDEDIFYHGDVFSGNVSGSLYEDPDIFYHGLIAGGVQTIELFRLLLMSSNIIGNADFVDFADEVTLQEQGATAEGTEHLGILIDENTV